MAIKPEELRLGNLVNRLGKLTTIEAIQYNGLAVAYLSTPLSGAITSNQIEPIPLSEEWLTKFGFDKKTSCDELITEWHIGLNPFTYDWLFCITWINGEKPFYKNGFHRLEYVHQLQNLFFA